MASLPALEHVNALRLAVAMCGLLAGACREAPQPPTPPVAPEPPPPDVSAVRPRGLWVLCEGSQRVLENPGKIPQLIDDARALGVSDLFVQVYRGGRAWFDSSLADAAPYLALRRDSGRDTLAQLIEAAHAADLRVHAWVNVLSLSRNRDAPLVRQLGRTAVLVDQAGRSLLDYPDFDVPPPDRRYYRLGTPGVWLDPAAPGVAERLATTFGELAQRYPGLDGIHLDYIRYPGVLPFSPGSRFGVGLDMGHGAATRARFRSETGLEAPSPPDSLANANRWDEWRRDAVTRLVALVRESVRAAAPRMELSAAVWSHADRAYLSIGQDWRRWLEEGLLEFAVAMVYTLDDRLLRYQVEGMAHAAQGRQVWMGIGTWLFAGDPGRAVEQLRIARAAGAAGDALFSWDSIADAGELRAALAQAASASGALAPVAAGIPPAPATRGGARP